MRSKVEVVSRCSGAKSTKVPGGEPAPISLTSQGTCALMQARSTASGTARSSAAAGGRVAVSVTGSSSSSDRTVSTSASVLQTVLPPGKVIRTASSGAAAEAEAVSRSRQSRGYLALAILPVVRLTTASQRSLATPVQLTSVASTSSPSIDLTGYRRRAPTVPSMLRLSGDYPVQGSPGARQRVTGRSQNTRRSSTPKEK